MESNIPDLKSDPTLIGGVRNQYDMNKMSNEFLINAPSSGGSLVPFDPLGLRGADSNTSSIDDQFSPSGSGANSNLVNDAAMSNVTGGVNSQSHNTSLQDHRITSPGCGFEPPRVQPSSADTHQPVISSSVGGGGLTNTGLNNISSSGGLNNSGGVLNDVGVGRTNSVGLGGIGISPPIQKPSPPPITSNFGGQHFTADQILSMLGQQGILNQQTTSQPLGQSQGSQQGRTNPQSDSNETQQLGGSDSSPQGKQGNQQLINFTSELLNNLVTLQNLSQGSQQEGQGSQQGASLGGQTFAQSGAQNQQNLAALLQTILISSNVAAQGNQRSSAASSQQPQQHAGQQAENPLPNNMFTGIFNSISNLNGGPNAFPPNFPLPPFEAPSSQATNGIQSQLIGMQTAASGIAAAGMQTAASRISGIMANQANVSQGGIVSNQQPNVSMRMPSNHSIHSNHYSNQSQGQSEGHHSKGAYTQGHNQSHDQDRNKNQENTKRKGSSRQMYNGTHHDGNHYGGNHYLGNSGGNYSTSNGNNYNVSSHSGANYSGATYPSSDGATGKGGDTGGTRSGGRRSDRNSDRTALEYRSYTSDGHPSHERGQRGNDYTGWKNQGNNLSNSNQNFLKQGKNQNKNSPQQSLLNYAQSGSKNHSGGGSGLRRASSHSGGTGLYNQSNETGSTTGSGTHSNSTSPAPGAARQSEASGADEKLEYGAAPEDCPETAKKGLFLKTIRGKFSVTDYLRSVEEGDPRIDPTHPDYNEVIARKHVRGEKYSVSDEIDLSTLLRLEQSQYMEANSRPVYTLFIFRRDLRIQDNSGFLYCCFNFQNVLPCFIFTPEQIYENLYYNPFGLNFLMESLSELDAELRAQGSRMHLLYGDNVAVLTALSCKIRIANICYNRDWSPYARERDALIRTFCHHRNITLHETEDYLLRGLGTFLNYSGEDTSGQTRKKSDHLTKGNHQDQGANPNGLSGAGGRHLPTPSVPQNCNGVNNGQQSLNGQADGSVTPLTNQSLMSLANADIANVDRTQFDSTTQNVYSISRISRDKSKRTVSDLRTPSDLTSSSNTGNSGGSSNSKNTHNGTGTGVSNNVSTNDAGVKSEWSSVSSSLLDDDSRQHRSVGVCYTTFTEFKANALSRKVKKPIYFSDNMKNLSALPELSRDMSRPWSEKNLFLHQMENRVVQKYVAGMGSLSSLLLRVKEFANIVDQSHPRHLAFASIPWTDLESGVEVVRQNYKIAEAPISSLRPRGGRLAGVARLGILTRTSRRYHRAKNTLVNPSSQLAAYLRFGCISIREIYFKMLETRDVEARRALVTGLYWREFYSYICFYLPETFLGKEQGEIKWVNNQSYLDAWCQGRTGFPIVDAGIHEMLQTTHMHMRTRLITAFFLSRVLGIHWRYGENFFAAHLIDYDPAINNGNWQWVSAIGVNAKPLNQQVYNPWTQSSKHDPQARYIKKWLPQLRSIPPKELHSWNRHCFKYDLETLGYVAPIVNYSAARLKDVERFSDLMSRLGYDMSNTKEAKEED